MKKKVNISVVIPYFKKRIFFEKTIKSIVNQSYKNFEIILIYDDVNQNELIFVKNVYLSRFWVPRLGSWFGDLGNSIRREAPRPPDLIRKKAL